MDLINCYATDAIVPLDYYRLVFREDAFGRLFSFNDIVADKNFRDVYNGIGSVAPMVPTLPYSRAPGDGALVIDCKATNNAATTVGAVATRLNSLAHVVDIVSIEHLPNAASVTGGAAERAKLVNEIDTSRATLSGTFGGVLGGVTSTLQWAILAVAIVAAVTVAKDLEWN